MWQLIIMYGVRERGEERRENANECPENCLHCRVCVLCSIKRLHFAISFTSPSPLTHTHPAQLIINEIGALIHTLDVEWALQFLSLSFCCHHQ